MEVKIKNQNGLIDATIEMVDGVMVVSPKKDEWKPKIGDVFFCPYFEQDVAFRFESVKFEPYGGCECEHFTEFVPCFKTEQECQEFCERLNKAIENIKP